MTTLAHFELLSYEIHLSRKGYLTEAGPQSPPPTDLSELLIHDAPQGDAPAPVAYPIIDWAHSVDSTWLWVGDYELIISRFNSGG